MQIGRYFYATNTPFHHADHPEFKQMCYLLRPGYKGPSAYELSKPILNGVHADILRECKEKIKGETVCMSLDGWSNVHNEPLICCCIVTSDGDTILVDSIDTGADPHSAANLKNIALKAIKSTEKEFGVNVRSFVTDNAANVQKMRSELASEDEINIIEYGCSAHMLNLLAKDLELPTVTQSIIKVIKHFRNKHIPSALYKSANGKKLLMPQEIRWNTMNDSLQSYLDSRGILVQICQDNQSQIDKDIIKIINDNHVTTNAVELLSRLKPIAVALDRMQQTSTTIAVAVEIWNKLEKNLQQQPLSVKAHFYKRRNIALRGEHYAANMLDHRFLGQRLSDVQKQEAFKFINDASPEFVPFAMAMTSMSKPFPKYVFGSHFRNTSPLVWWKSLTFSDGWPLEKAKFIELCLQLLTAKAATADLERHFSSFGLVQSKLRNRLGTEKATKLVFMFKHLNQHPENRKCDLNWVWEGDGDEENSATSATDNELDELPIINLVN